MREAPSLRHVSPVTRSMVLSDTEEIFKLSSPWRDWWERCWPSSNGPILGSRRYTLDQRNNYIKVTEHQWENHIRHVYDRNPWQFWPYWEPLSFSEYREKQWEEEGVTGWPRSLQLPITEAWECPVQTKLIQRMQEHFGATCRFCLVVFQVPPRIPLRSRPLELCPLCDRRFSRRPMAGIKILAKELKKAAA